MVKLIAILGLLGFSSGIFAVEEIERLMVERAQTAQEKKAIHKYLTEEAAAKKKMAKRLRDIAKVKKGGKAVTQDKHKEEMLKEAESLESLAKDYEELAKKVEE